MEGAAPTQRMRQGGGGGVHRSMQGTYQQQAAGAKWTKLSAPGGGDSNPVSTLLLSRMYPSQVYSGHLHGERHCTWLCFAVPWTLDLAFNSSVVEFTIGVTFVHIPICGNALCQLLLTFLDPG